MLASAQEASVFDPYERITASIIESIEQGVGDPVMPWHRGGANAVPENIESGNQYRGVNIISLWVASQVKGYGSNIWGTYRQWREAGAQVRKGEKSSLIVFYKELPPKEDDEDGRKRRMAKASFVFNADQVDGYTPPELEPRPPLERIETTERYVARTGAEILEGGTIACYRKSTDTIHMPDEERFFDTKTSTRTESYYSVLLHELTHWTGAEKRLHRDLSGRFGSESYAMEELVAELGAAFQCAKLGVTPEPRKDHACYIAHWLKVLKEDKKAIFTAAARAQEAVEYLVKL